MLVKEVWVGPERAYLCRISQHVQSAGPTVDTPCPASRPESTKSVSRFFPEEVVR